MFVFALEAVVGVKILVATDVEAFVVVGMSAMFSLAEQDLVAGRQLEPCVAVESLVTNCSF